VESSIRDNAENIWSAVAERLREALSEATFQNWFGAAEGHELTDDFLVVSVPNEFTREWIENHFLDLLRATVRDVIGDERGVLLAVVDPLEALIADPPSAEAEIEEGESEEERGSPRGVNPKYTFDLFIIGSSNRFAHAAALSVAERPARAYNPLFIYGGTGLGKTHLLHAIAHYVSRHSRDLSVFYVTSESFMNDFIDSLRDKRIDGFKQRYRHYDVLLVDDLQFFEGKERIQEEFFHTFNALFEAGSQIVLSSDRPPRELATLEPRLRSRFEWGLTTDIQPPDLETRIAILRKKVRTEGIHVPDTQVLTFIGGLVSSNIRELEGALTRVVAFSSLTGRLMTVELAEEVLEDVFPAEAIEVSIHHIQEEVADRFGLSLTELCSDRRSQNIVYPRQVAMYLSRELTDSSLPKIGKEFGGRDHTTVIHATSKIARLIKEDRSAYNLVQELTARIKRVR
jgi:chromosomal replication initiator protein